ncbi:MAG: hypothetical protein JXJ04_22300 [Spirochaetales bacterium]|nr:hypothetical protein [Spirochaetales bacterium]
MNHKETNVITTEGNVLKLAFLSSYGLSIITFITFVFAMIAVPISGAHAPDGGISYPYLDTIKQYPGDYIWQYVAMFMICLYVINITILSTIVTREKQIYMKISHIFAIITTVTLLINYFVHVSVVPISLMNQEYEGISLFTQYNPHGLFIALEELGYIMMVISFGFLIPVFRRKKRNSISIIYFIAVIISIVSFIIISIIYGLDRQDRYEVIIISITWLVLIINGILIGNKVRKVWKDNK